jgi:hypothetical protein
VAWNQHRNFYTADLLVDWLSTNIKADRRRREIRNIWTYWVRKAGPTLTEIHSLINI